MLGTFFNRAMKNIPTSILPSFEMVKSRYNESRASITVISHDEKAVDIVLKTPMVRMIQQFTSKISDLS